LGLICLEKCVTYPEDFERREGEDGVAGAVFEGESEEEENYLGDVGDEEVH
jgi:hypothetical protein